MQLRDLFPKPGALALALLLIAGAVVAIEAPWKEHSSVPDAPADLPASELQYPAAADFQGATGWLGTPDNQPLVLEELRGKVVLVDFWTYSCINCIHTFPYLRTWWERYQDDGLVIVGVHTPEFRFERDAVNVQEARERYGLSYPAALDNDYGVWEAYHNRYWPAEYLVDHWGRVRHTHFGEGGYEETEALIRQLLTEAGHAPSDAFGALNPEAFGSHSPELYAASNGGTRHSAIGNPEGYHAGQTIAYARPAQLDPDEIYLAGTWANGEQNVTAAADGASVLVRFHGLAGNVVAQGPEGACVAVLLDGAPIAREVRGPDVGDDGCVRLDAPRSYDFYAGPNAEHTVELRVPAGFALFTFDFSAVQGGMGSR
ncbi:MAG TPA: redoxin domain-containing protein [Candidatus Thermoplasmatota archaeon]|jgi:thiol-disulfide isomerase/thioredoxin|nr:redoxin domain-containing protein [Candidatus Thermoplasmatota archaeon]